MELLKPNAIRTHFAAISKTIRIFELCIVFLILSWTLTRLPLAVSISAEYLRKLAANPLFIFAVSNAIIAALFAQSGRFSDENSEDHSGAGKLYRELMNCRIAVSDRDIQPPSSTVDPPSATVDLPPVTAEVTCQDKEVISETVPAPVIPDREIGVYSDFVNYRRTQSEKWKGEAGKMKQRKQLRRSETAKLLETSKENLYPQDKLSNEEFQRTIDAFIAKQMKFLREESSAIVVHNSSTV
ncbi:hypothetical protein MtrunA17_Chr8g0372841 [Medicago truncatula]|uniref:Transmembrane protein, putative n=1 Tax=Medicago truncatula TaxID=3880 RepID=A0A072TTD0_MEDTR|nr:uncharacterized protein LOC25501618 [Medicago truncatula]KEH20411.1 transmembrane protein, putative [Medicago truncatula]RHN42070.1 hypothetical protein MtrunA17_Chr8g0372841 [Medicago truncatula]